MGHLTHTQSHLPHTYKRSVSTVISPTIMSLAGGGICALAALPAAALAVGRSWQGWMPLAFTAVLFLTALLFGSRAGLLGSVLAALIFSLFLFGPTGRVAVADSAARMNVGWMTLTGIAFSLLFAPPRSVFPSLKNAEKETTEYDREAS